MRYHSHTVTAELPSGLSRSLMRAGFFEDSANLDLELKPASFAKTIRFLGPRMTHDVDAKETMTINLVMRSLKSEWKPPCSSVI